MSRNELDVKYMRIALLLAEKGRGFTRTNPFVGAVIVKNNKIIAKGYHRKFGGAHAEINAIKNANTSLTGSTMYVTLEPCSTFGKTPPCTEAIKQSGIKRVVIAALDPNPLNARKATRILKRVGIEVKIGVLRKEAERLNEAFHCQIAKKRPFIILKMAQSLDGKSAAYTGHSKWITGQDARKWVHTLRNEVDAVMVGTGTVQADNPQLTVREVKARKQPDRIAIDRTSKIPLNSLIYKKSVDENIYVGIGSNVSCQKKKSYEKAGISLIDLKCRKRKVLLKPFFEELYKKNIGTVLVEGGATLAASLFEEKLIDKIAFFCAPIIVGGKNASTSVAGQGAAKIDDAVKINNLTCRQIGKDFLFEGYPVFI